MSDAHSAAPIDFEQEIYLSVDELLWLYMQDLCQCVPPPERLPISDSKPLLMDDMRQGTPQEFESYVSRMISAYVGMRNLALEQVGAQCLQPALPCPQSLALSARAHDSTCPLAPHTHTPLQERMHRESQSAGGAPSRGRHADAQMQHSPLDKNTLQSWEIRLILMLAYPMLDVDKVTVWSSSTIAPSLPH